MRGDAERNSSEKKEIGKGLSLFRLIMFFLLRIK
ncbi:UNVERIFIED_ORG: hypothetical protein BDK47_11679 [Anoxybacillus amylolyticus]